MTGKIYRDVPQGTPEWHALRCGKVTASRIADIMAKPRVPGEGMRVNYMAQLVIERLTGKPQETYSNATMEEGRQWEDKARAFYAFRRDVTVEQVTFIDHPDLPMAGCSPDGLVVNGAGEVFSGLVEFKCPFPATHLKYYERGAEGIDGKYLKQMQFQMACSGVEWCDFCSYNDDFPEDMRGVIIRVPRHNLVVAEVEDAVRTFMLELNAKLAELADRRR